MLRWLAAFLMAAAVAQARPGPDAQVTLGPSPALDACLDKNPTTMGMEACYGDATRTWDARLNAAYKRIMASDLSKATKDEMRAAQRAWIAYVPLKCRADSDVEYEGGSMARIVAATCVMTATALRATELEAAISPQEGSP